VSLDLKIKGDFRAINRDLDRVQRKLVPKATAQALNRTNRGIRTDFVRAAAQEFQISPQKKVRERIAIPRHSRFVASPANLRAGGVILFKYLPLILTLKGKPAQRAAQGPNQFLATMPSGKRSLFRRKRSKGSLPIAEVMIDVEARAVQISRKVLSTSGARRWNTEFERSIKRVLKRK